MPGDVDDDPENAPLLQHQARRMRTAHAEHRKKVQALLSSKQKHYIIMGLVALDVAGILADIFVALIACDKGEQGDEWVEDVRDALKITGLVISCLFLVELGVTVWAFGLR